MTEAVTPHVVVFADLSPQAKVQYTRFLLKNDVKFQQRASDKRFVANIRLVKPPCTPEEACDDADPMDKRLAAVPEALRAYANLIVLIGDRPESSAGSSKYVKETRLVRFINEVYDTRYEDLSTANMTSCGSFAKFIRHYLTNRFGLKRLVDQQGWDLIEGLHALQHGKYPERTLAFFLFARASLQRLVNAPAYRPMSVKPSNKSKRKTSSSGSLLVWLSKAQAETLAETVFGSKLEDTYIEFMHAMKAFLGCDSSIARVRTAARLLDSNEFLFIATETYHKSSAPFPSLRLYEHVRGDAPCSSSKNRSAAPLSIDRITAVRPAVLSDPSPTNPDGLYQPSDAPSSTGAAVVDDNEEEEAQLHLRLDSLLERVKKRQQGSGL
ncbi:hypothetical protein DVH05_011581 [Phytophthora capsici]|nr:hypothetical protein DVH05_011581 [Phytophthora capsici]